MDSPEICEDFFSTTSKLYLVLTRPSYSCCSVILWCSSLVESYLSSYSVRSVKLWSSCSFSWFISLHECLISSSSNAILSNSYFSSTMDIKSSMNPIKDWLALISLTIALFSYSDLQKSITGWTSLD